MILLDSREPSELEDCVRNLGVDCSRAVTMSFGDAMFTGSGPDGECSVGFERKRLSDLIGSMKDRRLSGHQLRGCWQTYDFVYLVSEGIYREGDGGSIEEWRGKGFAPVYERNNGRHAISYEQLDHYLCTLELKGGVIVKRTKDMRETARFYASRWRWFNNKSWAAHNSHDQIYTGLPMKAHGSQWGAEHDHDEEYVAPGRGRVNLTQANPTTAWRWGSCLPGVDRKAEVVAKHFKTAWNMVLAGLEPGLKERAEAWMTANPKAAEKAWMEIDFGMKKDGSGKNPGIGKVTAQAVVRAIMEEGG